MTPTANGMSGNNVTANVQSDHICMDTCFQSFFASDQLYHLPCSAEIDSAMSQQDAAVPQFVRIENWYSIHVKKMKKMKNVCNFYKVVARHFSGVVGKEVTVLFFSEVT